MMSFSLNLTDHYLPQQGCSLYTYMGKTSLETIEAKKKKRKRGREWEGEKVIWWEELGKYGGVFISENDSIGYKHH